MAVRDYDLCVGGDLRICETCRRNVDNNALPNPHRQFRRPAVSGTHCGDWLAMARSERPAEDAA